MMLPFDLFLTAALLFSLNLIDFQVYILTWTGTVRYFVYAFGAKHMRLCVIAKFAAVVISTRSVARVDN